MDDERSENHLRERPTLPRQAVDAREKHSHAAIVEESLESKSAAPGAPPTLHRQEGDWRTDVQRAMLTAVAVVAPILSCLALFVRSSPRTSLDDVVIGAAGLSLPALSFTKLEARKRAQMALAIMFAAGVFFMARVGTAAGVSVLLVSTSVIAFVCVGRRLGLTLILATVTANVGLGLLVVRGALTLDMPEVDPLIIRNWLRVAAVTGLLASLLGAVVDFVIRRVEAASRAVTIALSQVRQLHNRMEHTREEERRFLARELHDAMGQTLTTLKLRLAMSSSDPSREIPSSLSETPGDLIDRLITDVRKISGALRPPLLDEVGLIPAVRAFLYNQAFLTGLSIRFHTTDDDSDRLPADMETACFRIIQESVTNTVRHAKARRLRVRLGVREDGVTLVVEDDGCGFDPEATLEAAAIGGHLGVVGMRERVHARGGVFRLRSRPGSGTTVEVELPTKGPGAATQSSRERPASLDP